MKLNIEKPVGRGNKKEMFWQTFHLQKDGKFAKCIIFKFHRFSYSVSFHICSANERNLKISIYLLRMRMIVEKLGNREKNFLSFSIREKPARCLFCARKFRLYWKKSIRRGAAWVAISLKPHDESLGGLVRGAEAGKHVASKKAFLLKSIRLA